jgi:hypothetical protein
MLLGFAETVNVDCDANPTSTVMGLETTAE